jgi:hypothetical protein
VNDTMTPAEITAIRNDFETAAHKGYVSYGSSMTDGYYTPEPMSATVASLHRSVPVDARYFRADTEFRPTKEMIDAYNATFYVGADYVPETLDVAVHWASGWRTYTVTGRRHAFFLIRKFARRTGFQGARLRDIEVDVMGYEHDTVTAFHPDEINNNGPRFAGLTDQDHPHYSLSN